MKRMYRFVCLLLACLMMVGTLTACDLADALDEALRDILDDQGDRYEDDEEDEYETKKPAATTEAAEETNSLGRPDETIQWGDSWGEAETTLPQTEPDSSKNPFKDPFKDEPLSEEQLVLEQLKQYDFGGMEFTVYCHENMKVEMAAEALTGDLVNDAAYERNLLLEESCNLKWVVNVLSNDVMDAAVKTSIMAGAEDFQLIDAPMTSTLSFIASGMLYSYEYLGLEDLSNPWWDQGTAEFKVNGQVYFMAGAGNTYHNDVTYAVFCNKNLYDEFSGGQSDLYDVVLEGMWTLDKMEACVQNCYVDLNGNGKRDGEDMYGFSTYTGYANTFFVGSGLRYVAPDEDGVLAVTLSTNMLSEVGSRISYMYNQQDSTFVSSVGEYTLAQNVFREGRSMFYGGMLGQAWNVQDGGEDIRIIPVPKYDAEQITYSTWAAPVASVLSVPCTARDDGDTLRVILEGYTASSYLLVKPVYYATVMMMRAWDDPASRDVLDIVLDNRVYDYGLMDGSEAYSCFENGVIYDNVVVMYNRVVKSLARSLDKFLQSAQ